MSTFVNNCTVTFPMNTDIAVIERIELAIRQQRLSATVCFDVTYDESGAAIDGGTVCYPYARVNCSADFDSTEICDVVRSFNYEPLTDQAIFWSASFDPKASFIGLVCVCGSHDIDDTHSVVAVCKTCGRKAAVK